MITIDTTGSDLNADWIKLANPRATEIDRRALKADLANSFEGHSGRPGERGGSVPRGDDPEGGAMPQGQAARIFAGDGGPASAMEKMAARRIAEEHPTGGLVDIRLHPRNTDIGSFNLGGKEFQRGGYYDRERNLVVGWAEPDIMAHELGHCDFQHAMDWADEAITDRTIEFMKNPGGARDVWTDRGGFLRSNEWINDPKNAKERLYNALQDYDLATASYTKEKLQSVIPTEYARSWHLSGIFDGPSNGREQHDYISPEGGSELQHLRVKKYDRIQNEAFAEYSAGYTMRQLEKKGLLDQSDIANISGGQYVWENMGTKESRTAFLNLRKAIADVAKEKGRA
jgi:hypothetical protein